MQSVTDADCMRNRIKLSPRLRHILLPYFKPTRSHLWRGGLKTFLLVHPFAFEVWFRFRAAYFFLRRHWAHAQPNASDTWQAPGFFQRVLDHNYANRWLFNRGRTEKLMNVLRCVGGISRGHAKLLVIGPRNEAEMLLLSLYGFPLKNMTGVDLFSYSPLIRCMDMHKMDFEDNRFDIVYASFVLRYSYDLQRACSEILRVSKNGGLVVVGWTISKLQSGHVGKGSELLGGLSELLAYFQPHVEYVYWQDSEECPPHSGDHVVTAIFRVNKL